MVGAMQSRSQSSSISCFRVSMGIMREKSPPTKEASQCPLEQLSIRKVVLPSDCTLLPYAKTLYHFQSKQSTFNS